MVWFCIGSERTSPRHYLHEISILNGPQGGHFVQSYIYTREQQPPPANVLTFRYICDTEYLSRMYISVGWIWIFCVVHFHPRYKLICGRYTYNGLEFCYKSIIAWEVITFIFDIFIMLIIITKFYLSSMYGFWNEHSHAQTLVYNVWWCIMRSIGMPRSRASNKLNANGCIYRNNLFNTSLRIHLIFVEKNSKKKMVNFKIF